MKVFVYFNTNVYCHSRSEENGCLCNVLHFLTKKVTFASEIFLLNNLFKKIKCYSVFYIIRTYYNSSD